ncbi:hypothetical protein CEUSTIGMA_g3578.t1 [Chlamydomonas eustigma]|uniref:Uncharacterized protein n=1 Tax=Chlamydomonas eustigma TaxID=1157962 RepID=A0A250WZC8_9CHLO|nr:hypothetical protein CEUSTIGMA_g3578.t1 [Chlamydomonas eustigma]|eukprot:GAX76135.1 hypothetical protein CEUSTIGMA_g3578.t1 [Chlamydomonas eustigma]
MLHTQNVFFQLKSSLHSQEFHGQEERNQVACSGLEKLEIGVDRKLNIPARHILHASDEDKPALCEKNTEQEFVMMTNSSQEDPLLQLAIVLATQQLPSPKAVHQDAEHMTAEEPDLHHRQGGENATTTAGSQQGTDTLHCEQADVSNPDVFRPAKNLMEQAEPFVQTDRKWMNGDNRALTQHLSLQERPQSPRISQHGMPSKDSNMHHFGYPRPVPLTSGSVVLYKAATVSAVLSENEPSPSPNVMLLQSCRQEASGMEAAHCDAFAPENKVSQDFEESEVLRWEVNRSNNQAQDQPALFTPGTVSILVGEPAAEHAASLQGHKVGAVTAEVIRLPEEMQHLGSTARNVSHLSTEDVPQPLNSLLDNGLQPPLPLNSLLDNGLQLPLPSHLKGLRPGLRRLEKGLGAVGAGTILERVYKTALKEVDDMLNVKAWLMELLHLIPDEVMAHPPPTHLPVDQDDTIHFHIPVYLSVPDQSTHDLYHTAQMGPQRSVLSEDECMVLIRTLLCAGKALVAAASSSGPSHSSAALSGSAASSSGLFMVSQSKPRQGAATELPGPTAAAVAAATEAGTPYEQLLLYSRSSALRPVPLYSLDLSGHEVTDRVMCDLVACAEDLGQECKLQALRMSRVLLTMGQRFSQESPLWSLAIKAPSLSHQLRLLDLSYNLHIVWDDVLWFTLLTSLSSLQHLDVRSTGFDDYGLKKLLWAFVCPAVSCKDSLQCLRLGPPSSATSSGPLPYSYDWSNFYLAPCLKQGLPRLQGLEVVGGLTEDQQQTIMEVGKLGLAVPQGRSFNGSMFTMRGADRDIFGEQYDQDGVFGRWKEHSIKQTNYRGPSSAYFSDDSSYGVPGAAPWDLLPSESGASLRHHTLQMHEGAINKQQQQQKSHAKAAAASFYQQFGGGRQASVGDKCRSIDLTRVQPGNEGACKHGEREQASAVALHGHRGHRHVQAANPRQHQRQGQYHNKTGAIHQGRRRAVPRTSGSTMRSRGHVSKADVRRNGSNVGTRGSSGTGGLIKGRPVWRSGEMEGCDQGLGGDLLNSSPDAAELKHGKRKRVRASASGGAGHCRVEELLEGQAGCEDLEGTQLIDQQWVAVVRS